MRSPASSPLLSAERLQRSYHGVPVVNDVSLALDAGEILAIVGPNGAGKSTLFRLLLRLERQDGGTVSLDGVPLRHDDPIARRKLAGVFQQPLLFSGTVRDNIGFGMRDGTRAERQRRIDTALAWFDLAALGAAQVRTLSGGEAQRVALARALVLEPDVLLLDEPSAGLDTIVRSRFLHELDRVARRHARGVILITHDPRDAFGLADRIAVMHQGRIMQVGAPQDIMLRPATVFAAELSGAELLLRGRITAIDETLATVELPDGTLLRGSISHGETLQPGDAAQVAYRPEDVVLAPTQGTASSAINRLQVTVVALTHAGAHVRAQLRAEPGDSLLNALLTRGSVQELGIAVGTQLQAHLKASALHVWRRGGSELNRV